MLSGSGKQTRTNIMTTLSEKTKAESAIQMVIMDAIEKGHTNTAELAEYIKSEVFEKSVKNYMSLISEL